jgi:hypothetical protein
MNLIIFCGLTDCYQYSWKNSSRIYQTTQFHISEGINLYTHLHENLKCQEIIFLSKSLKAFLIALMDRLELSKLHMMWTVKMKKDFPVELDLVRNRYIFMLISYYYWGDNGIRPTYILQLIILFWCWTWLKLCRFVSSVWCLKIKMERLPSYKQMFFLTWLTTCFGPDRTWSGDSRGIHVYCNL